MRLTAASFLLLLPTLTLADWPRFRGPNGSGLAPSANTPASFSEKDFNWSLNLPGKGHSSPVIIANKIFITCGDPASARRSLVCVSLDTGTILWQRDYDSHTFRQHNDNSYASSSPTADKDRVYFTFTTPASYKVYALDHAGQDAWTHDMGPWQAQHGAGPSPILFEDLLIVPNLQDGPTASLTALDTKTGQPRWKLPRTPGNASKATPVIYYPKTGNPQIIITNTGNGMTAIDARAGTIAWTHPSDGKFRAVGSPIAAEGFVVATWGEGARNRSGIVAIPPGQAGGGSVLIAHKIPTGQPSPYVPCPLITPDNQLMFLWSDAGIVTCIKTTTWQTLWQRKLFEGETPRDRTATEFYSSPVLAGDKLYNITKKGEIICLKAGDKFELLGRSPLNDQCYATPAIDGNRLIIRTASKLISVGK